MNYHIPVLLDEVMKTLDVKPEGVYMDCTIGFGGHAESILNKLNSNGILIGMDLDPYALEKTKKRLSQPHKNISLHNCSYSVFPQILEKMGINKVDGFLFDLGISSYQIDSKHRGFSYMKDAPLDMRFNHKDSNTITAKELINTITQEELFEAIKTYADIPSRTRVVKSIINARNKNQLNSTFDLKEAICKAFPYNNYKKLSQIFQVIRILVNDEIEILKRTLKMTLNHLEIGGKIVIISFHSIEDRIVKHFFKNLTIYKNLSYDIEYKNHSAQLKVITKRPIIESSEAIANNPRSSSAKLRAAERIK